MLLVSLGAIVVLGSTLYVDAFAIKPAGDDFELVTEIVRGERDGPGALFARSLTDNFYRPTKSFLIWLSGRGAEEGRAFRIRLAHFVSAVPYLVALALWLRLARLQWAGAIVAIAAFLLHPGLVATLSSIDGCGGMLASGFIWLGAWIIAAGRDHPRLSLGGACLCFVAGLTCKEYIFSLVPLGAWSALVFRRRWRPALITGAVLSTLFLVHLPLRSLVMATGSDASAHMIVLSPASLVKNAMLAVGGLTFVGDTVWLFLNRGPLSFAIAGASMLLAVAWLATGLRCADKRWTAFLLVGLAIVMFPALLHHKNFAEKYLCPLLLPFALMTGLAFQTWQKSRFRVVGFSALLLACVAASAADLRKNADMRAAGEFAEKQCLQVLELLGPNANHRRALLVFEPEDVATQPRYSIFRFGDDSYVMGPTPFTWWRPEADLKADVRVADQISGDTFTKYDLVARWDAESETFHAVQPATATH